MGGSGEALVPPSRQKWEAVGRTVPSLVITARQPACSDGLQHGGHAAPPRGGEARGVLGRGLVAALAAGRRSRARKAQRAHRNPPPAQTPLWHSHDCVLS